MSVFDELENMLAPAEKAAPRRYKATLYECVLREVRTVEYSVSQIQSDTDAVNLAHDLLSDYPTEHIACIYLDGGLRVMGCEIVSHGGISSTSARPREIFQGALAANASALILAHNHPSGDPKPSKDDLETTQGLTDAGRVLGIPVLDHLVVTRKEYTSIRDILPGAFNEM